MCFNTFPVVDGLAMAAGVVQNAPNGLVQNAPAARRPAEVEGVPTLKPMPEGVACVVLVVSVPFRE